MPWDIKKDNRCSAGKPFGVVKRDDNELEGCHVSRDAARKQLAALNAQEGKSVEEEKAVQTGEIVGPGVPFGVTSFAELDAAQQARVSAQMVSETSEQFTQIVSNIMMNPDIENKVTAVTALAEEFPQRIEQAMAQKERWQPLTNAAKKVINQVKEKIGPPKEDPPPAKDPGGLTIWKEADVYQWLAIYSNNYRDDDNPPEILSADAHRDFVKAVDAGEWPMPELWFWHVPGTRLGITTMVAFDEDTGFSLAAGTIDKEREAIAEALAKRDDLLVSHGMPLAEIMRDEDDSTIITRYRSKEISALPARAAANKHTGFVIKEDDTMRIPDSKVEELKAAGYDMDALAATLAGSQAKAESEERESKEVKEEVVEEAPPAVEETPEAVPTLDLTALADTIGAVVGEAIAPLVARLDALEEADEEKELRPQDPASTFATLLRSRVIGAPEARVDGRKKEARDAPAETTPASVIDTGNPLADSLVSRIVSGQTMKELSALRGN